ncbi:MAG: phosphoribosylamine--glycine ligase [Burkholderiaceae bacterium]|jgi:phosphoribosylamine--glycine ligase|nr:phosphoribosylamine--glycine ligase [Burkholderiaceae bacterium]
MKVLVIGSGGREHALAWKLTSSPQVQMVYVAPGNAGISLDKNLQTLPLTDTVALREWAQAHDIGLTVVGPEAPLAAGVVDEFRAHGLRIFGPTQAAAQLESSKAFSKAFMQRHHISTAAFQVFEEADQAHAYVDAQGAPIVVKADGLAAGKGVVVATTVQEAHQAIDHMLALDHTGIQHTRGKPRVVIEEWLDGEEASFMVVAKGLQALALATSQDHKRLLDGDLGPNTGGMGAYSPAPVVTPEIHARVMREVIQPTLKGMMSDGIPYTGFLYAGLMISPTGQIKVLEFNCRMGDPETQPILMRLKSDLLTLLLAATDDAVGDLTQVDVEWDRRVALGVVMAAHGYPQTVRKGDAISGLPPADAHAMVFHAATQREGQQLVTAGGRVLCVTALGDTVRQAQSVAYSLVDQIHFDGAQVRRDIGHRAIKR